MIDGAYLEADEGGWVLVLDDSMGTHAFPCDPQLIEDALRPWRMHELEGEVVAAERRAALRGYECADPEGAFVEMMRESADVLKKRDRES